MTVHVLIQRTGSSARRVLKNDAQTTALFLKHARIIDLYILFLVTSMTIFNSFELQLYTLIILY